jgi:hypothetical protein
MSVCLSLPALLRSLASLPLPPPSGATSCTFSTAREKLSWQQEGEEEEGEMKFLHSPRNGNREMRF